MTRTMRETMREGRATLLVRPATALSLRAVQAPWQSLDGYAGVADQAIAFIL